MNLTVSGQPIFGVKASLDVNHLSGMLKAYWGNNGGKYQTIQGTSLGWAVGVYSQLSLKNKLFFAPELEFSKRHYDVSFFQHSVQMGFVQLNSLVSFQKSTRIALEGGPSFSRRIVFTTASSDPGDYSIIGFNKKNVISFITGVRLHMTKALTLTTRFTFAVTPIANKILHDDLGDLWRLKLHNNSVQVGAAYKI